MMWIPRLAPITRVFRKAASSDPEIAHAWEEYERRRHADARAIVGSFAHLLRPGLTVDRAADMYWAFSALDSDALIRGRGWSLAEYVDWHVDAMDRLLLR